MKPYLTITPCHNDLHSGNIIFSGKDIKAIDYEDASQNDPYFDLATLIASFDTGLEEVSKAKEKIFLTTYLERTPTAKEEAKLYLMKQLVLVKWIFDHLRRIPLADIKKYESLKVSSWAEFFKAKIDGKIDFSNSEVEL